jgi:hypothetical protein
MARHLAAAQKVVTMPLLTRRSLLLSGAALTASALFAGPAQAKVPASATATSSVSARTTADPFVLRATKPVFIYNGHASNNVGLSAEVSRTNYSGTINFANGPVNLTNLNITNLQTVVGTGHRFTNCLFNGSYSGDSGGGQVIAQDASVKNLRFDFCEFRPSTLGDRYNGVYGHDFTISRSVIRRSVDGLGVYNPHASAVNVSLLGCWVGQLSWYLDDGGATRPNGHLDGTHNDGIQQGSGTNLQVIGNLFNGARYNAVNPTNVALDSHGAMMIEPGNGLTPLALGLGNDSHQWPQQGNLFLAQHSAYHLVSDIVFEDNWLMNGDHGFKLQSNFWGGGRREIVNVSYKRNKYSGVWRDWGGSYHHYPARWDSNCTVNGRRLAGGVYDDTDGNVWENSAEVPSAFRGKPVKLRVDAVPLP